MTRGQEVKWALGLLKPNQSVLLDECVVVCLTPVGVGRDWSNFELIHLAPDPEELRSQLKPRPASTNRVFMEGAHYFIAVNPNGALLDVFYDPWGGGTMSPAWKSKTKATAHPARRRGWKVGDGDSLGLASAHGGKGFRLGCGRQLFAKGEHRTGRSEPHSPRRPSFTTTWNGTPGASGSPMRRPWRKRTACLRHRLTWRRWVLSIGARRPGLTD